MRYLFRIFFTGTEEARSEDFGSSTSQLPVLSINEVFTNPLTNGLPLSVFCRIRKALDSIFGLGPSSVC